MKRKKKLRKRQVVITLKSHIQGVVGLPESWAFVILIKYISTPRSNQLRAKRPVGCGRWNLNKYIVLNQIPLRDLRSLLT